MNKLLPLISITLLILYSSCNDAEIDSSNNYLSSSVSCERFLTFDIKRTTFAKYSGDVTQLTVGEKATTLPISNIYKYDICENNNVVSFEIVKNENPSELFSYPLRTLGNLPRYNWRSNASDGIVTTTDEDDIFIGSSSIVQMSSMDGILDFLFSSLIEPDDWAIGAEALVEAMDAQFIDDNLFMIETLQDGEVTRTYFENQYQKEVAVEQFKDGELSSRRSYTYKIDERNMVILESEIFQVFTESIDTDKEMTIVEIKEYTFNK